MVFKLFDYLSPRITLYYYGRKRHSSSVGGILTIIMVFGWLAYIIYIVSDLFLHKSPTSQYYRKFFTEAGYFPFDNKEGIFHYFQLYNTQDDNLIENFNTKYIRIFMSRYYNTYKNNPSLLSKNDHWVYDICEENDFFTSNLINNEEKNFVNKSICLRYFYNSTLGKYFSVDDKIHFKHPYLIHGSSNTNNLFLSTIVEKCQNDSITSKIFGTCESEEEINEYLKINIGIKLLILNHQIDTFNYLNPISVFISKITNELNAEHISINDIDITPLQIKTHDGFLTEVTKNQITYTYEENRKSSDKNSEISKVLNIYYYWLQNNAQIYERKYKNIIDDIIPRIGGIIQTIFYLFYFMNIVFHKLNTIRDTRDLIYEWNKTLENVNIERRNYSRIVKSLQDVISGIKSNSVVQKSELDSRINNSKKNDFNINQQPNNTIVFCGNENSKNPKIENAVVKLNDSNSICNIKINDASKNNNIDINQSNSNVELNIQKSLNSNSLFLNKNRKNTYFPNKPKKYIDFSSEKIAIIEKKKGRNFRNTDNPHIPISNLLMNIDSKRNKNRKKKKKKNNKKKKKSNKYIDVYKLGPAKISMFNHHMTLCEYVFSMLCCIRKKRNAIFVLEQFRKKLLSEEHFFRTNIFLCLAEKFLPLNSIGRKIDIVELYENL